MVDIVYEFHEIANVFPLLEGKHFLELVEDIRMNGLLQPIITFEDKVLDGRHRYNACLQAGVEPQFAEYEGTDPIGFVTSLNLSRRHLTRNQQIMAAGRLANLKHGLNKNTLEAKKGKYGTERPKDPSCQTTASIKEAADIFGVGEQSVKRARKVLKDGTPELVAAVEKGEMTVTAAAETLKKQKNLVNPQTAQSQLNGLRVEPSQKDLQINAERKRTKQALRQTSDQYVIVLTSCEKTLRELSNRLEEISYESSALKMLGDFRTLVKSLPKCEEQLIQLADLSKKLHDFKL
jgi:ParB-like chromosome segregation protein Spo0J